MDVLLTVLAGATPTARLLRHLREPGTTVIAPRSAALAMDAGALIVEGRLTVSEPDVQRHGPTPSAAPVRGDLLGSVTRACRRSRPPQRIVVLVDLGSEDLLTVISTLVSSPEITRRCSLDAVVVEVDAIEMATRLSTGAELAEHHLVSALAVADRIVVDGHGQITDGARRVIMPSLASLAGFARVVDGDTTVIGPGRRLDAWHGAPEARQVAAGRSDRPSTIVLHADEPLDADAVDDFLSRLVSRHADRLLRVQGALRVRGRAERTCCIGVRGLVDRRVELPAGGNDDADGARPEQHRSGSLLAVCAIGLDVGDLAADFQATVAT